MTHESSDVDRAAHLRSAVTYLVAWLVVVALEVGIIVESGGIRAAVAQSANRTTFVVIVAASIVLLALAINHFLAYVRSGTNGRQHLD